MKNAVILGKWEGIMRTFKMSEEAILSRFALKPGKVIEVSSHPNIEAIFVFAFFLRR